MRLLLDRRLIGETRFGIAQFLRADAIDQIVAAERTTAGRSQVFHVLDRAVHVSRSLLPRHLFSTISMVRAATFVRIAARTRGILNRQTRRGKIFYTPAGRAYSLRLQFPSSLCLRATILRDYDPRQWLQKSFPAFQHSLSFLPASSDRDRYSMLLLSR